jgi:protease-4
MNKFWSSFFGSALGTFVSLFISAVIIFIIFIAILTAFSGSIEGEESVKKISNNSVLRLKFDYPIPERTNDDPFANFDPITFSNNKYLGLNDIQTVIKAAQTDDKISGILLDLSSIQCGMATLEEIRNALQSFKRSKKFVYCYADVLSQKAYYLGSVADKVFLNPMGEIEFIGLSSTFVSFKNTLDKIGVEAQIIRPDSNKFKSAVEPFILEKMSNENRAQTSKYLNSVWSEMLSNIAQSRNINIEKLQQIAGNFLIRDAISAKSNKIIDEIFYKDELEREIRRAIGIGEDAKISYVSPSDYVSHARKELTTSEENKIAIVYAVGEINYGAGDGQSIGSSSLCSTLKKVRDNDKIKGVVLRVNSPGGSALASEIIWREVVLTKAKKPVVVSMGDLAASGGYYISAPADYIVADNTTLTGSIGVFGILMNLQKMLNEKVGIITDTVKTNNYADFASPTRPLNNNEKQILADNVNKTYKTFLKRVADGRGMKIEDVDKIGQGRVWTGKDAIELNLVDKIGNVDTAIAYLSKKIGIEKFSIEEYPKQESKLSSLLGKEQNEAIEKALIKRIFHTIGISDLSEINFIRQKGVQARLPYNFQIN